MQVSSKKKVTTCFAANFVFLPAQIVIELELVFKNTRFATATCVGRDTIYYLTGVNIDNFTRAGVLNRGYETPKQGVRDEASE